jgi:hypothetical protein
VWSRRPERQDRSERRAVVEPDGERYRCNPEQRGHLTNHCDLRNPHVDEQLVETEEPVVRGAPRSASRFHAPLIQQPPISRCSQVLVAAAVPAHGEVGDRGSIALGPLCLVLLRLAAQPRAAAAPVFVVRIRRRWPHSPISDCGQRRSNCATPSVRARIFIRSIDGW